MGYSIKLKKERKKLVIEFAILGKKMGFMVSSFLKNYFVSTY